MNSPSPRHQLHTNSPCCPPRESQRKRGRTRRKGQLLPAEPTNRCPSWAFSRRNELGLSPSPLGSLGALLPFVLWLSASCCCLRRPTREPWLRKVSCLLCKEALWTGFCIREKFLFVTAIISVIFTKRLGNCQLEATSRGTPERLLSLVP